MLTIGKHSNPTAAQGSDVAPAYIYVAFKGITDTIILYMYMN